LSLNMALKIPPQKPLTKIRYIVIIIDILRYIVIDRKKGRNTHYVW
jgi:hypothetical protein